MTAIEAFAQQVIESGSYSPLDRVYVTNKIKALVGEDDEDISSSDLVDQLVAIAVKNKKIVDDTTSKEILNDLLHDLATPIPSEINRTFWEKMGTSPKEATDWFYNLCIKNNYIKKKAIDKNIVYEGTSSKGHELEITINLSKPEKDPQSIAKAALIKNNDYPKCALCLENEGYLGDYGKNSRSNLRIVRMTIGGQQWGMQYSPYAYFDEHCIFLDQKHVPMVIDQQTLINLIEIERMLPHYFVGSNADLSIVGGSMLAHEHYQGGKHIFPMMKAKIKQVIDFPTFSDVKCGIVDWPMSDLRLISSDTRQLIKLADLIINFWDQYSDQTIMIHAYDEFGQRHHTVTPIMHREDDKYILDLVLRDNNTSDQYLLGIFHPHEELWHIKKENIGLIEVMGRAILPGRLKDELQEVKKYLLHQPNDMAEKHEKWAKQLLLENHITADNVDEIIRQAVIEIFEAVLQSAGVFKDDSDGKKGQDKFIEQLTYRLNKN
ncbi:galactose-1-phosphate uridylyltransferase [Lactobacillus pasteurii DSM 23907 = CRBIP 24.76]|uniref:Galactose-1-phosphate uridylyltransferase n=1 Tax=Lactobacillus pasteurii DSM 23907 = CRBIP 24.76 TaxID=1423790 RepID=I7LD34_9LACO|nr:UDP-glucose--hexose-1-phosphate uridylyltransferase [Lactobacillus pasteurii]KRK07813.1 galactose-1-phosphate uridylyltransferase [Lactobacillus pasteurii DSM 23907 = CRBIP 24.76]TDG77464.1 hypothetical protein C5L33_000907 [Lactobacillus pasteurii]CCI84538.1 Galactose-1-phosphate uridylyltransferase [Lactobacillus pasteurii DSM 23907 = CRBIP 24.76]